ncbi:MAG: DoxX family protein [Flavobacteriales bacterium]|nr:DoxX family protein [Flavobacteriales bacterium]MCX7650935.1 DoxX family protein [Flavobacteriales bacterium]MDW8432979.1 DoxX family protein [Flavobacteriales bacterium]
MIEAGIRHIPALFCTAFLAILFLQSGIDKLIHRADNLKWLQQHFAQSRLRHSVPQLLSILTALEVFSGIFCFVGFVYVLMDDMKPALFGVVLSMVSVLALFFGQRMAKDYAGAAALVPYALMALAAFFVLWFTPLLHDFHF